MPPAKPAASCRSPSCSPGSGPSIRGEVLEVELEEEHGRLVYEIKLLRPGGRLAELLYDAATGEPVTENDD